MVDAGVGHWNALENEGHHHREDRRIVIVMRTPENIVAVDWQTGKRVWETRDEEELQSDSAASEPMMGIGLMIRLTRPQPPALTILLFTVVVIATA